MQKNTSKWFYAFLTAIALLLVAAVTITVMLVNQNKTPEDEIISEGAETGVYYYDVVQGEIILSLNSGNKFTIAGPELNKSGTYTVSDQTVTLTFIREEDGVTTATLGDNSITLTYKDAVMTFLRKVNYTVTFNSNGGDELPALQVVNGKPATKPNDPSKAGHVFLGWYSDAELKNSYDFTGAVTTDTTVYAAWAQKVAGQAEYVASLNLGYAGAGASDTITTIGGKLYNLPTPEREGYTFSGWYVSMYEDGEKLSYAYTSDTVLDANTTLYAVWQENNTTKLASPKVSVGANSIKWDAVSGASAYQLKITDSLGTVIHEETLGATTKNYNFTEHAAGDYSIEVVAVANNTANNSDATVRYYRNKALNRVSKFQVVNGVLVFNAVENAEKYIITVDCGNKEHNHTLLDNGASTTYSFNNCLMQKGGIKFTVIAQANGYASSIPETFVYEKNLSAVDNLVYNATNDTFVWNEVADAAGYIVTVTVGEKTYTVNNGLNTVFSTADYSGDISVSVTPVTDGYNSPDATTATCKKTAPATPKNVQVNGLIVTWDAVEGATKYEIKVGSTTFDSTTNSIDLSDKNLKFSSDTTYQIQVKAIKDGNGSSYSKPVIAEYQSATPVLSYNNKTVYWSAILGCSKFEVRVNGGDSFMVSNASSAAVTLTKAGVNTIEVKCVGIPGAEWVSINVFAYEVVYNSRTVKGGEVREFVAIGDAMTLPTSFENDGYYFNGWYNTPSAATGNGKEYTLDVFNGNGDMTLYANWSPNDYNIKFIVDSNVANITNGSTQSVTYTKDFTLTPAITNNELLGYFVGWYTGPNGSGIQITDSEGLSVAPYDTIGDIIVYPYFADAVLYVPLSDGTYAAKKGSGIVNKSVTDVKISATYNGAPVTKIADNGFYGCSKIVSVEIPDTITRIGIGAFENCYALESFNVYEVDPNSTVQKIYSSSNGALLYFDEASGNTYLEIFPRAKTGTYLVPEEVDNIRPYAFKYSKIDKVIISKGVSYIAENAFFKCSRLETIEFEFGRETSVTIETDAFTELTKVKTLILPAKLAELADIKTLDKLEALEVIQVEEGGEFYSASNNFLCDAYGTAILYVPKSFSGAFEAPMGITSIGSNVFSANEKITEVILPAYVTNIGDHAFESCINVTKVTVKGPRYSALSLGVSSFQGCEKLTDVIFEGDSTRPGTGATTIGEMAFADCIELKSLTVGDGAIIELIGNKAFSKNTSLSDLNVSDTASIIAIGDYAFENCTSLKAYTVHASTTSVGNYAFTGCAYIETVEFAPNGSNITFGEGVFQDCFRLTKIKLPATLAAFDGSVFDGCEHISTVEVAAGNPYLETYNGALYTKGLTELIYYPRSMTADLSTLPWSTLTKIGASVFKGNAKITSVEIGANITEIGNSTFENCINLTSVSFKAPDGAMKLGNNAFYGCLNLTGIQLPTQTTSIGDGAFYMTQLSEFTIPSTVTYVGNRAFAYTNLTSINFPAAVTYIGDGAFYATKLTTATFEGGTSPLIVGGDTHISEDEKKVGIHGAFMGTSLTTVDLPKNTALIGDYAFAEIATLTTVNIPADAQISKIGCYAFYKTGLTSIYLTPGMEALENYALALTKISSISIPASIKNIHPYALSIPTLTSVTFDAGTAESELTVHNRAFVGAAFTEITFPAHLAAIGEYNVDFSYHTVVDVFYQSSKIPSGLTNNANLAKVHVAEGGAFYASKDGILYLKDNTGALSTLLFCPQKNSGDIVIPNTVINVQTTAFVENTGLTSIVFEEFDKEDPRYGTPLLTIGAFDGNNANCPSVFGSAAYNIYTQITLIKFPSHLDTIYSYAFYGMRVQKADERSLVVEFNPDSDVALKQMSLRALSAARTITLPKVREIGSFSFYNIAVESITFAPGTTVTEIGERAFESCGYLTYVKVPASVQTIARMAFYGCYKLTNIEFEKDSQLTTIHDQAFQSAAMTSFKIPDSVSVVGSSVFANCNNLETLEISINMQDPLPGSSSLAHQCRNLKAIIVPEGHEYLKAVDGILYDKEMTILYVYPAGKGALTTALPSTLRTIEGGAFNYYAGTSLTLPEGVEYIKNNAFYSSALESINIPASVREIHSNAFYYNSSLKQVTFAENSRLEAIGNYLFDGCSKLESVEFPDNLASMGQYTFQGCHNLLHVTLPAALTALPDNTFRSCSNLQTVVMQEGLQSIGTRAFFSCNKLQDVTIPDTVTTMGEYVFYQCTTMENFILSENSQLTKVGRNLMHGCTNLKNLTFGPLVAEVGENILSGCTGLVNVVLSDAMTEIPANLFKGCADLESVHLPASAKTIGLSAFEGCAKLTELNLSSAIESIGENAFKGCTGLETFTIESGANLKEILPGTFENTVSLTNFSFPATVVTIGDRAFKNSAISEAPISAVTTKIGDEAFYNCTNLTSITLLSSVTRVGASAFEGCSNVETLSISIGLKYIGDLAFAGCEKIKEVTLPETVAFMGANPFANCTGIESLTLDSANESFVFDRDTGILYDKTMYTLIYYPASATEATFVIPDSVYEIAGGAFAGSQLQSMVIPENIKTISNSAFKNSKLLTSVVIPESITLIDDHAFEGCEKLNNVSIPASVTEIGDYAFAGCASMTSFNVNERKTDLTIGSHLFENCSALTTQIQFPGISAYTDYMYAGTGIMTLVIPEYITDVSATGVFANCEDLISVQFHENCGSSLGDMFFYGCSSLLNVDIPSCIYTIGKNWNVGSTFMNCTALRTITFSANTILVSTFENCTNLTTPTFNAPDPYTQLNLDSRAFANCTSLSSIDSLGKVYNVGAYAFLNCTGLTGEISFGSEISIRNYAFAGCLNLQKINFNGRVGWLEERGMTGLPSSTVIYLKNYKTIDDYMNQTGNADWMNFTDATIEYYKPSSGGADYSLTAEEKMMLEKFCGSWGIKDPAPIEQAWVAYKTEYAELEPASELTKEEQEQLMMFIKENGIDSKAFDEIAKQWIEYRFTLAKELADSPANLTAEEQQWLEKFVSVNELSKDAYAKIRTMWVSFKKSYNDPNPSDDLSKEEIESFEIFFKEFGIKSDMKELMAQFVAYKKTLAASMQTITYYLTEKEMEQLNNFAQKYGLSEDAVTAIKDAWNEYKINFNDTKVDKELSKEDQELLNQFVKVLVVEYGVDEKTSSVFLDQAMAEWPAYRISLAERNAKAQLDDNDNKLIMQLIEEFGVGKEQMETVSQKLFQYKKFYNPTSEPGKELSVEDSDALRAFIEELGLPSEKYFDMLYYNFIDYNMQLYKKMMA